MSEFRMPSLGADMEAGTLIEWLKRPGDRVARGDIIAVVDTDKGAIEIEVFEDGVLEKTIVDPGQSLPVGTVMAIIGGSPATEPAGRSAAAPTPAETAAPRPSRSAAATQARTPGPPAPASTAVATRTPARAPAVPAGGAPATERPPRAPDAAARPRVSPAARRVAAEHGIDLALVTGTGAEGAITLADVEQAATAAKTSRAGRGADAGAAAPAADKRAAMRAAIAAAMTRAKREIPHYYLATTVDFGPAAAWLRAENERRPMAERLLPAALLIKAVALALRDVPELNGHWIDGRFRPGPGVHVGVAISLRGGGLVAPALHEADRLDLATLMARLRDLVARARAGSLRSSELSDATITVTNLGDQGVESTFGIIYPPQVALVGFGRISERPWAVGGALEVRPLVTISLSADHRATDGHRGGLLLAAVDRRLQTPEKL
jgi:pyruvate dehydrogenase E2 component (dihydrolipoamide acetyltransferase)